MLTRLSNDTTKINGIALSVLGVFFQTFSTIATALIIGFYYEWRLTLINILCLPFIILASIILDKVKTGGLGKMGENNKEAGSILSESVVNTKTIFCFNMQEKVVEMFDRNLDKNKGEELKGTLCEGFAFGYSQLALFSVYAIIFYAAGQFILLGGLELQNMFSAIFVLLFAGFGLGQAQQYVGDYSTAKEALVSLFDILDTECKINPEQSEVDGKPAFNIQGKIEFRDVTFSYPGNPTKVILQNLSFVIQPGQKIAFVGASGCGKSTIIQLLERFYDVDSGQILIDDIDIKEYNIISLRQSIGLVMQEPALFKAPIRENIRYGLLEASDEMVNEAAKNALIDNILIEDDEDRRREAEINEKAEMGLSDEDKKLLEKIEKSRELSGGQKQRVAIARSILKAPKILLFDEATSALDKESETKVQEAINLNLHGKTSISIAHRLVTIMNSDDIMLMDNGRISEQGTHEELINKKQKYYLLWISGDSAKEVESKEELIKRFAK
jgi:ABC-type multidrug transport system fused ATPase/permease subunit